VSIASIVAPEPLREVQGDLLDLAVDEITVGESIRGCGLDDAHVGLLMETDGAWPAILVWGPERLLVDGAHRLEAARRLGHRRIVAAVFVGSRQEALLEAIRSNTEHGLPLSLADRRGAARSLLSANPEWSDRRIASACGLSGRTVARVRDEVLAQGRPGRTIVPGPERRIGRDGKIRPVRTGEVRSRILEALRANPAGSLREIAAIAGASPETVRAVKARGGCADSSYDASATCSPAPQRPERDAITRLPTDQLPSLATFGDYDRGRNPAPPAWSDDAAFLSSADGGEFARWFSDNRIDHDWHRYVFSIPYGRIYEVVDEARRRANEWSTFASLLESRSRRK
jgi:hypothetical protein